MKIFLGNLPSVLNLHVEAKPKVVGSTDNEYNSVVCQFDWLHNYCR